MKTLLITLRIQNAGRISAERISAWHPDLKVWHRVYGPTLRMARLTMGGLNRSTIFQVYLFAKFVSKLSRTQGLKGVVLYLKSAQVMLMQSLPGGILKPQPREISRHAVSRCGDGLPRLIPKFARARIRKGDCGTIRLWITLLGIYRVLAFPGKLSIHTITSPGVGIPVWFVERWVAFLPWFFHEVANFYDDPLWKLVPKEVLGRPEVFSNMSSSADSPASTGTSSFGARVSSAQAWIKGEWGNHLHDFLATCGEVGLTNRLWWIMEQTASSMPLESQFGRNGRLGAKEEPAGKIRLFAIVDYWTQVSLRPLHHFLSQVLKSIPQDGTFDQIKPVKALLKRVPLSQTFYSFDLSAATDRLPISLQINVLTCLFGRAFAETWAQLLVGRSYETPVSYRGPKVPRTVRYAVGQPMGALSSWTMLALTHHALVQFSAYTAGFRTWFQDYAVLGDDLVIANDLVARRYRAVCRTIGLGIGLAKSLIAVGRTCEFAKRLFFRGEDVTGLPHNLWVAANATAGVALSLVQRVTSQVPQTLSNVVRALGAGYKQASSMSSAWNKIPRRVGVLAVLFTHPQSLTCFSRPSWLHWFLQPGPLLPTADLGMISQFTPWATGLLTEVVLPIVRRFEDLQAELFWDNPADLAGRLLDSIVNKRIIELNSSLEKAEASLKHLQKLNIKFMHHQSSAVFTQITAVLDRMNDLPRSALQSAKVSLSSRVLVPVLQTYAAWIRVRRRGGL